MSALSDRYYSVCHKIEKACQQIGKDPKDITLVAVSKFHPVNSIKEIAACGQKDFGENYIQEALQKMNEIDIPKINWHAIGPIQSKKTKDIINKFSKIHTLSSQSFLDELIKRVPEDLPQEVLLQINIGRENQKAGLLPEDCPTFIEKVLPHKKIKLTGLMCLPPYDENPEITRPYFIQLRKLKENIEEKFALKLPHLSMGMSTDFKAAIEEGATIIRVGTDIFGERPPQ